jgi:hypothetical protein
MVLLRFRSKKGYFYDKMEQHSPYLAQAETTLNVVVHGRLLVDGYENQNSCCTCIQENLHKPHYNCANASADGRIWIMQTAPIAANEELSIQYTGDGSFLKDRASTFPPGLYALACTRYGLTAPAPLEDNTPMVAHDLVSSPSDFTDELMDAQYVYRSPFVSHPAV